MDYGKLTVGVLALQGAFREHIAALEKLGAKTKEIRLPGELEGVDALIIPGGESTTMYKLIKKYGFEEKLIEFNEMGKPIFGTCAGMILISRKSDENIFGLDFIDIDVKRNAFGRQIDSFESDIEICLDNGIIDEGRSGFNAVFIRAPRVFKIDKDVEVLGRFEEEAVLVRQNSILASSFHPELTEDPRIHKYFLDMIISYKKEGALKCQVIQNGIQ